MGSKPPTITTDFKLTPDPKALINNIKINLNLKNFIIQPSNYSEIWIDNSLKFEIFFKWNLWIIFCNIK